jgi:predicted RNase H-like nuclease (RuvC/YqgF family)
MSNSPAEYVQKLEAENRALRRSLIEAVAEKQKLELQLARANVEYLRARGDEQMEAGHA